MGILRRHSETHLALFPRETIETKTKQKCATPLRSDDGHDTRATKRKPKATRQRCIRLYRVLTTRGGSTSVHKDKAGESKSSSIFTVEESPPRRAKKKDFPTGRVCASHTSLDNVYVKKSPTERKFTWVPIEIDFASIKILFRPDWRVNKKKGVRIMEKGCG